MSKETLCLPKSELTSFEFKQLKNCLPGMIKGINWIDRSICPFVISLNIALLEYADLLWSCMKDSVEELDIIVIAEDLSLYPLWI